MIWEYQPKEKRGELHATIDQDQLNLPLNLNIECKTKKCILKEKGEWIIRCLWLHLYLWSIAVFCDECIINALFSWKLYLSLSLIRSYNILQRSKYYNDFVVFFFQWKNYSYTIVWFHLLDHKCIHRHVCFLSLWINRNTFTKYDTRRHI